MAFDFDHLWNYAVKPHIRYYFDDKTANDLAYKNDIKHMCNNLLKKANSMRYINVEPLRYNIAASFTISMIKKPLCEVSIDENLFKSCELALKTGIYILKSYTYTYEEKKGNKDYADRIKNGYIYINSSFEEQLIHTFFWSAKYDNYHLLDKSGIFFISDIFQLIENLSKTMFIIETANSLTHNNPKLTEILNTKLIGLEFHN